MLHITPKVGRIVSHEAILDDIELRAYKENPLSFLYERGIEDVMRNILANCTVTTREDSIRATRIKVEVITMSPQEYRQAIENAFMEGQRSERSQT